MNRCFLLFCTSLEWLREGSYFHSNSKNFTEFKTGQKIGLIMLQDGPLPFINGSISRVIISVTHYFRPFIGATQPHL